MFLNRHLKELNKFAIPLILQFITSYLLGLTDIAIVSRISLDAFNSINLIFSILSTIAGVLGAITIVFNIIGGEKYGNRDKPGFIFEFCTSLLMSVIVGLIFIVLLEFFSEAFLSNIYYMKGNLLDQGILYLKPMKYYVLMQLLLFTYGTYFKVHNNTKWILVGSIASSIVNVVLDGILVLGLFGVPKLGIKAVGVASILAMVVNLLMYIIATYKYIQLPKEKVIKYLTNMSIHFKKSIPLILQEIIDGSIFIIGINMIIIRIGHLEYAGYSIINSLLGF